MYNSVEICSIFFKLTQQIFRIVFLSNRDDLAQISLTFIKNKRRHDLEDIVFHVSSLLRPCKADLLKIYRKHSTRKNK